MRYHTKQISRHVWSISQTTNHRRKRVEEQHIIVTKLQCMLIVGLTTRGRPNCKMTFFHENLNSLQIAINMKSQILRGSSLVLQNWKTDTWYMYAILPKVRTHTIYSRKSISHRLHWTTKLGLFTSVSRLFSGGGFPIVSDCSSYSS